MHLQDPSDSNWEQRDQLDHGFGSPPPWRRLMLISCAAAGAATIITLTARHRRQTNTAGASE